jgi:DNA-binding NtrC family response regulator
MKKRILVVDDEPAVVTSLKMTLEPTHEVLCASTAQEAIDRFRQELPNLVLLDLILPGADGLKVLELMRSEDPSVPVIMLTAIKTVKTAVDAMKIGAADYLTKPFDIEELRLVVIKTLNTQELEQEVRYLRAQVANSYSFHNLVGKSPAMREIYSKIEQIADTRATVLITGESGTGKELVARALHYNSARKDRPFIAINCASIPDTLIESELFGHEKGSFTGALARRVGKVELAHSGTLFLDEVGDLGPPTQAKVLRFLQEREFVRVGGSETIKVNVRIVAATNKVLEDLIRREAFREDLYYRINVISLHLSPLRDRREDIPYLAKHFLGKRLEAEKRAPLEISKEAMEILTRYHWPGNVRELENVLEQAIVWCQGTTISPDNLPMTLRANVSEALLREHTLGGSLSLEKAVQEFERELLLEALMRTGYVQTHAATMLGITRRMLKYRMDMLGIKTADVSASPAPTESPRESSHP